MNEVAQIVASIGFPSAAFIMAGWYIVQKDKQHREEIKTMQDTHKDEMAALQEAHKDEMKGVKTSLERLTSAIRELIDEWRKA